MSTKIKIEIDSTENITQASILLKYLDGKTEVKEIITSAGSIPAVPQKSVKTDEIDSAFLVKY